MIIEYAPLTTDGDVSHGAQQLTFDTSGFVQMELQGLAADPVDEPVGEPAMDDAGPSRRSTEPESEA